MKGILSFDVGTTSMKCILYSKNFKELYTINTEYSVEANGELVRLDADVYFNSFVSCVNKILESGIPAEEIISVVFTTQGETLIPVDKHGNPLSKAIVWLDTSAAEEAAFIKSNIPKDEYYRATGLFDIDGALPVAKIMHIKNANPKLYNKTYKFLFLEDYLILKLCGKFVSEKSLQSSSGWYDIINDSLYDKVFDVCGIDKDKIPDILPCGTDLGCIQKEASHIVKLSPDTHVVTGAMDQIASVIGCQNITEGIVTETTGTALVVGASVKKPEFDITKPITVYKHYNDMYLYMPYFATAGIVHKWFRDTVMADSIKEANILGLSSYTVMEEMARLSPPGSNGLIFNPDFISGGSISGLTLSTQISDLSRSVQEGIAYVLRDLIEIIESRGIPISEIYSMGGGAYSDFWCQIKASVTGKIVNTSDRRESTALGAAILASVALGVHKDVERALAVVKRKNKSFYPNQEETEVYNKCYKKYKEDAL